MEWTQFFILIVTVGGLFLWSRSESRSDNRELRASTEAILNSIKEEIKDFHDRLCAMEENRK